MKPIFQVLAWVTLGSLPLTAAQPQTAFQALAALPPGEDVALARVAGCEGVPAPERWHFIVQAPDAPEGLRDYAVYNQRVVARNGVSQFANGIAPGDVLSMGDLLVDSDRAGLLAREYARSNGLRVATLNYELRKDALNLEPVWKVTCLDDDNETVGWVLINARDGRIVAARGVRPQPKVVLAPQGEPLSLEPIREPSRPRGGFRRTPRELPDLETPFAELEDTPPARFEEDREVRRIEVDPFRVLRDLIR